LSAISRRGPIGSLPFVERVGGGGWATPNRGGDHDRVPHCLQRRLGARSHARGAAREVQGAQTASGRVPGDRASVDPIAQAGQLEGDPLRRPLPGAPPGLDLLDHPHRGRPRAVMRRRGPVDQAQLAVAAPKFLRVQSSRNWWQATYASLFSNPSVDFVHICGENASSASLSRAFSAIRANVSRHVFVGGEGVFRLASARAQSATANR